MAEVKNSIIQTKKKLSFGNYLTTDVVKNKVYSLLGTNKGDRFISSIVSAITANPTLQDCDNSTILSGALLGESLNLSPSTLLGQYYLVPFNDNKNNRKVAQFQIGWKGYWQLAMRTGQYEKINVVAIKQGELIKYNPLDEEIEVNIIEDDELREKTETIGYYAMFKLINGFKKSIYWSKAKMENHALKYSKGYQAKKGYTYWENDFDGMAFKTMLRQLLGKYGYMSIEMQDAYQKDMAVVEDDKVNYIDNPRENEDFNNKENDVVVYDTQDLNTNEKETNTSENSYETNNNPFNDILGE